MHRRTDPDSLRIDRTIPLPWLIGAVGALVLYAAVALIQNVRTGDKVDNMANQFTGLSSKIESLSAANQTTSSNIVQLQGQMTGLQNRLLRVETTQDAQRNTPLSDRK